MDHHPSPDSLRVPLAKLLGFALVVDTSLVMMHLIVPAVAGRTVGFFDLGAERNLPTWWSSGQLAWAGLLFGLVSFRQRQRGSALLSLALFACLLLALSLDEFASIHERIGMWVDGASRHHSRFPATGYWFAFLGIPAVIAIGAFFLSTKQHFDAVPHTVARLALGFVILFSGALAAEALSNFVLRGSILDRLQIALEEGLEMVGGSILLWSGAVFLVNHPSLPGLASLLASSPVMADVEPANLLITQDIAHSSPRT